MPPAVQRAQLGATTTSPYDPRWEYGFPARTESELAWVQHALARLRDGGTAVLLMPPAVASRRSGRRIRADLLRRGALRAVVALPAGAAPPYSVPAAPVGAAPAPTGRPRSRRCCSSTPGRFTAEGRGGPDWPGVRETVLDAWGASTGTGASRNGPGLARSVPGHRTPRRRRRPGPRPPAAAPGGHRRRRPADRRTGAARRDAAADRRAGPPPVEPRAARRTRGGCR
ncbi:hypothetical protein GCM10019016_062870 [Streptomyces prasinosporus]|uniref:DNA methylase adenine-specific domain-containing protein n=1 Tax=Streptomyces prasinosporus TaxID=68256 RepID=A0ABP6TXK0_9ACTN